MTCLDMNGLMMFTWTYLRKFLHKFAFVRMLMHSVDHVCAFALRARACDYQTSTETKYTNLYICIYTHTLLHLHRLGKGRYGHAVGV